MGDRSASQFELVALREPQGHYDVAVLGGGLAGLTVALQLKRQRPASRILLAEKKADPPREAAFKVGESSVEVGAHYYREVVGMRDHLEKEQLRKHGLRFLLPGGDNSDITKRTEFCTPAHPAAYTHQIDRGRFENELFDRNLKAGVDAFRGFRVQQVDLGDEHTIRLSHEGGEVTVTAHWVVDATGRANVLRKQLGVGTETGHDINASWFRLAGGLDFETWGADDEEWLDRMPERGVRQYSTTHLVGAGYWLWLIQLATGPISIGICADPRIHPFEELNTFEGFLDWMRRHEPQLAAEVEGRQDQVLDFLRVGSFSYASSQIFSKDRWTLAGEAAGFIDALYSPGSDFIAYTNTFGGELINAELDGQDIAEKAEFYNDFFLRIFNTTVLLYRDMYQIFGNPQVMVAKIVFDSLNYFTTLGSPFVHGRLTKEEDIRRLLDVFEAVIPLIGVMQNLFRDWAELDQRQWEGVSVLSKELEPYIAAQEEIGIPAEFDELIQKAKDKIEVSRALAVWIFHKAAKNLPEPPDEDAAINPLAISLHPERWEQDGLYSGDGLTLAQALDVLGPGIQEMDLEARGAVAVR